MYECAQCRMPLFDPEDIFEADGRPFCDEFCANYYNEDAKELS